MYLNRITIIGRLVAVGDFTKGDKPDGSNDRLWGRIACNRPNSEETDFVPFVCWAGTARAVAKHCGKGKVLILDGRLATRSKQREDGSYDNYAEVNCSRVYFGPDVKNVAPEAAEAAQAPVPAAPSPDVAAQMAAQLMALMQSQTATPAQAPAAQSTPPSSDNPFA